MRGGDELKVNKELGHAGAEALAPYVGVHTRLWSINVGGAGLGAGGMRLMVDALKTNMVLTVLDVSDNRLQAEGAKVVAELLARWVGRCLVRLLRA